MRRSFDSRSITRWTWATMQVTPCRWADEEIPEQRDRLRSAFVPADRELGLHPNVRLPGPDPAARRRAGTLAVRLEYHRADLDEVARADDRHSEITSPRAFLDWSRGPACGNLLADGVAQPEGLNEDKGILAERRYHHNLPTE